jgi:hypothetical protein
MNKVLRGFVNKGVHVDEIVVHTKTREEHNTLMEMVYNVGEEQHEG